MVLRIRFNPFFRLKRQVKNTWRFSEEALSSRAQSQSSWVRPAYCTRPSGRKTSYQRESTAPLRVAFPLLFTSHWRLQRATSQPCTLLRASWVWKTQQFLSHPRTNSCGDHEKKIPTNKKSVLKRNITRMSGVTSPVRPIFEKLHNLVTWWFTVKRSFYSKDEESGPWPKSGN